ncbi:hypothetical protein [Aliirhizobium smilacinae]|uniref:Uncharacterized protein n=1 Tax=Aliirhizobium smilacinae TaxID=1395944 RepID=A0A5C4XQQ3_9HYPH|nr:hypothetical protein [Rhizobium smilacinae]TNM65281.1 hypothetical protein FHP24_03095 [Rhizobium smilacinae]
MDQTEIIPRLLRAANDRRTTAATDLRDLLQKSIVAIHDLREEVGIPGSGTSQDAVIKLMDVASNAETSTDDQMRGALLEAADMIRTLKIVADSGIALTLRMSELEEHP